MLPFGVTNPATVPQGSEIPEGLMNNPVDSEVQLCNRHFLLALYLFIDNFMFQWKAASGSNNKNKRYGNRNGIYKKNNRAR
jgi:hypothetical protein